MTASPDHTCQMKPLIERDRVRADTAETCRTEVDRASTRGVHAVGTGGVSFGHDASPSLPWHDVSFGIHPECDCDFIVHIQNLVVRNLHPVVVPIELKGRSYLAGDPLRIADEGAVITVLGRIPRYGTGPFIQRPPAYKAGIVLCCGANRQPQQQDACQENM